MSPKNERRGFILTIATLWQWNKANERYEPVPEWTRKPAAEVTEHHGALLRRGALHKDFFVSQFQHEPRPS